MDIDQSSNKSAASHFIKMYDEGLKLGLYYIEKLFTKHVVCNLHIYKDNHIDNSEFTGYIALKEKLFALGITTLNMKEYCYSSQFTGRNLLLTINGTMLINQQPYTFTNTLVLKYINYSYIIVNYILQIFK